MIVDIKHLSFEFSTLRTATRHKTTQLYRAFHRFGQVKFPDGVSVFGLSQFSILLQLLPEIMFDSKVVNIDPKIK